MSRPSPHHPTLLVVGPTPPPHNGMSVATSTVLDVLGPPFRIVHLDTADRRPLSTVGRLDLKNVVLAVVHAVRFLLLLRRHRPNLVYVPIAQSTLGFLRDACFLVPCRLARAITVVHLHGGHFATFYASLSPPMRAVIRYCLGRVACAIVLGQSLRGMFDGILSQSKIAVVPNGVSDFCGGFTEHHIPSPAPRILFLSTLKESKGVLDVLRAVPLVRQQLPSVEFHFVGEWGDARTKTRARSLVQELGIASSVRFLGAQHGAQKQRTLCKSHLFLLPSYYEGQPLAILEAMCASLPVLASPAGCIEETVVNGVSGVILPARKPDALAEAILELMGDPHRYRRMAMASRERFETLYTSRHFGENLARALDLACGLADPQQAASGSKLPHADSGRANPFQVRRERRGSGT